MHRLPDGPQHVARVIEDLERRHDLVPVDKASRQQQVPFELRKVPVDHERMDHRRAGQPGEGVDRPPAGELVARLDPGSPQVTLTASTDAAAKWIVAHHGVIRIP